MVMLLSGARVAHADGPSSLDSCLMTCQADFEACIKSRKSFPDIGVCGTRERICKNACTIAFPRVALVAAVLPTSRSVQVGTPATVFATLINTGQDFAKDCRISSFTNLPATFIFQATNPATNQPIGTPNTLVAIPAGASQSFVLTLTPTAPFAPTELGFSFACAVVAPLGGTAVAPIIPGVNTLLFSASPTPVPDLIALAATVDNDGIVKIPGATAGVPRGAPF